jgi:hypothetical protein
MAKTTKGAPSGADDGTQEKEGSVISNQRGGHDTRKKTDTEWQSTHQDIARKDAGKDWSEVKEHRPVS